MMSDGWSGDVRSVVRRLKGSPGFVAVAVASLAIGIGANSAVFGAVRALLMDPLPVESPEELYLVAWRRDARVRIGQIGSTSYPDPAGGTSYQSNFTYPMYQAMRDRAPEGAELFPFAFVRGVSVASGSAPALLAGGMLAGGSYFQSIRVGMAVGRPLTPADDQPDAPLTAVLGYGFWMRAFGGDPDIVGQTVRVNGTAAQVVGVTEQGYRGLSMGGFFPQTDITLPMAAQPRVASRWGSELYAEENTLWLRVMARLPDAVPAARVAPALTAAFTSRPSNANQGEGAPPEVALLPGAHGAQPVRASSARTLYLVLGAGGIVLLIACVNLAGLMLARGLGQQREMAIRRALGSGRLRLLRQSLLESVILASLGTAAGLALAFMTREGLGRLVADTAGGQAFGNIAAENALDPGVILFAVALGGGATLLFGTLPAVRLSGVDPMAWLKQRSAGSMPRLTAGRVLLSLQIAVSIPLLMGSALLIRTLTNLRALELGFEPEGMYTFQLDPTYGDVPRPEYADLYLQVLEEIRTIPGVTAVSLQENPPLSGIISNSTVEVDGASHSVHVNAVGPDFLRAVGMNLVDGRMPGIQDMPGQPRVAVVNERVVREVFGGASPLGRTLDMGSTGYEIIGVINDSRYRDRRSEIPPTAFPSALQRTGFGGNHVVVRSSLPHTQLDAAVRQAVGRVNLDLPVPGLTSQVRRVQESTARERLMGQLMTALGVFTLLLASIGVHGVVAYSVARRTREIGVRVAVGAHPGQVRRLMLKQVLGLCLLGLALGIPAALAAGPVLESLLYGVAPGDGWALAGTALVLLAVVLSAGYFPARRASRLDPLVALRTD
jgi:predicted permease